MNYKIIAGPRLRMLLATLSMTICFFNGHMKINAEASTPDINKVSIEMEMVQPLRNQRHIIPFSADKGVITIKQELVTGGNVAYVSVLNAGGEQVGEATLDGFQQTDIELPQDGQYLFMFSNYKDNKTDTERYFTISLSANHLIVNDKLPPKMELSSFDPVELWDEPVQIEVASDSPIVAINIDGRSAQNFDANNKGEPLVLTLHPENMTEGMHKLDFVTRKENGTVTWLTRSFLVDYTVAFQDVPKDHWAHKPVEVMQSAGMVEGTGDGFFDPGRAVTRQEFAKMLAKVLNLPASIGSAGRFVDVPADSWAAPYIEAAAQAGLIEGENGDQGATFHPDRPISRAEASAMIARTNRVLARSDAQAQRFADVEHLADWAKTAITKLNAAGWIDGYEDGNFHPADTLTRAEAAKLLFNFIRI